MYVCLCSGGWGEWEGQVSAKLSKFNFVRLRLPVAAAAASPGCARVCHRVSPCFPCYFLMFT